MPKPTQLSLPLPSMSLRRVDPASNCFRFYLLDIERDLFGQTVLARRWGRIGTYGGFVTLSNVAARSCG
jgi:predicted DNA-binding WGR domain protein